MPDIAVQPASSHLARHAGARRVALVTGGGGNIGAAICRGFAESGIAVAVADVNLPAAEVVAEQIRRAEGAAIALRCDIGDRMSIEDAVRQTAALLGEADILVNNGAKFSELTYKPFEEIPLDEWDEVIRVNVTGAFHFVRAVAPGMKARKWGRIINVSSGSIRMGRPLFLHYVSSKSALVGMTRSLARELGPFGVTVNVVLPGVVFSDLQRKRLSEDYQRMILTGQCIPEPLPPEAMVGPVLFLASDDSRYVTGQELAVDGGLTHG